MLILSPNRRGQGEDSNLNALYLRNSISNGNEACNRPCRKANNLKIIKGWKKISNQGGYVNENTGQTLIVAKKEFSENYHVLLFAGEKMDESESKKISPEFSKETKAEAFALDWMGKHPNGMIESKD